VNSSSLHAMLHSRNENQEQAPIILGNLEDPLKSKEFKLMNQQLHLS
jgi:hypothetical protein